MKKEYSGCEALSLAAAKPEEVEFRDKGGRVSRVNKFGLPQVGSDANGWIITDCAFSRSYDPYTLVEPEKNGEEQLIELLRSSSLHASRQWTSDVAAAIRKIAQEVMEEGNK